MYIKSLKLNNFRNYKKIDINFSPDINVLYGKNAQGKTNILEAIIFLSSAKSFRTAKTSNLINKENKFFLLETEFKEDNNINNIKLYYEKNKKKISLNNIKSNKFFNLIGFFKIVAITPEDIYLIKGENSVRRQFLDINISLYDSDYFENLRKYKKILKVRNKILKEYKIDQDNLAVWSNELINYGSKIIYKRLKYINKLEILTNEKIKYLSNENENLTIKYKSFIKEENSLKDIFNLYKKNLENNLKKDILFKTTSVGPHRDDIIFSLNGLKSDEFSSEGQKRCIVLGLKASVFDIIYEKSGKKPVILIDDAINDLDEERFVLFYNLIKDKNQIFISTTKPDKIKKIVNKGSFFKIKNGEIIKRIDI